MTVKELVNNLNEDTEISISKNIKHNRYKWFRSKICITRTYKNRIVKFWEPDAHCKNGIIIYLEELKKI